MDLFEVENRLMECWQLGLKEVGGLAGGDVGEWLRVWSNCSSSGEWRRL